MLIRLEGEEIEAAVERVRKRGGDRDWKAAVVRVVLAADATGQTLDSARAAEPPLRSGTCPLPSPNPADPCTLSAKHSGPCRSGGLSWEPRTPKRGRKGAKS